MPQGTADPSTEKGSYLKPLTRNPAVSIQVTVPRFLKEAALSGLSEVREALVHKENMVRTTALSCTNSLGSTFIPYTLQRRWAQSLVGFAPTGVCVEAPR